MKVQSGVSSTQKVRDYFWANKNVGERGKGLEVYVRSSFTVVNLHDLYSNYPCSICHFM